MPEPLSPVTATISYRAECGPCVWEGPIRRDNLAAFRDFQRHESSRMHTDGLRRPGPMPDNLHSGLVDGDGAALCECCGEAPIYSHGECSWCNEACPAGRHIPYTPDVPTYAL